MDAILRTENLCVEYRARGLRREIKPALKELNLAIHAGEVFGFLGPNGAGKTTTMNVLLGFVPADAAARPICLALMSASPSRASASAICRR